jgi:hypothetical protein
MSNGSMVGSKLPFLSNALTRMLIYRGELLRAAESSGLPKNLDFLTLAVNKDLCIHTWWAGIGGA